MWLARWVTKVVVKPARTRVGPVDNFLNSTAPVNLSVHLANASKPIV